MQRRFDWVIALGPILGVLSCSDPVPASSAVGLNLSLTQKTSCPIMTGVPDDIGNPPPDSTTGAGMGKRIFDGEGGVSVSCAVKASGNGEYSLDASIRSSSPRVSLSFSSGSIQSNGTGTVLVGLTAQALSGTGVSSPPSSPCTLNVIEPAADHVKPGAIWFRFNCPTLTEPPVTNCNAAGEVVLENCKK